MARATWALAAGLEASCTSSAPIRPPVAGSAVAIQPDGKILLAAATLLLRYLAGPF
jgi:hypothetical protein